MTQVQSILSTDPKVDTLVEQIETLKLEMDTMRNAVNAGKERPSRQRSFSPRERITKRDGRSESPRREWNTRSPGRREQAYPPRQMTRPENNSCWTCGSFLHFARNCPEKQISERRENDNGRVWRGRYVQFEGNNGERSFNQRDRPWSQNRSTNNFRGGYRQSFPRSRERGRDAYQVPRLN